MKVLPKFHGSRTRLEAPLQAILAWCANPDAPDVALIVENLGHVESVYDLTAKLSQSTYCCPHTAGRVVRMLQALYTDGFAAFG
ncbi:MAG: hypothetical protein CYG60_15495 [Actinobacteria bacterium]|nr:MAG: hypothetical protein CYG60_15495 [Actinomycetota bacterium]